MRCVADACDITIGDIISGVGGWCVYVCMCVEYLMCRFGGECTGQWVINEW